jgi:cell division protein FtsB
LAGRIVAAAVSVLVVALVVVQFTRAIGENVGAARELSSLRSDIGSLEKRRDEQQRELRRLRDPQGAVPEIHDRLRLVRPNEAIIFVSPQPASQVGDPDGSTGTPVPRTSALPSRGAAGAPNP